MSKPYSEFVAGVLVGVILTTIGLSVFLRYQPDTVESERVGQRVLKLGHGLDTTHPAHLAMVYMKTRLEEVSGDRMTIDIYPSAVLGSEIECIEQLQNGSLSMTKTSAAAMESIIPSFGVFSLPYVFRDESHFWNVLDGPIGEELLARGDAKRLHGLCYYDAGSRNFYTKSTPVRDPSDLTGLKIRVMNSATAISMVKVLGASPTPIAWGELYSALAQGTVDGAENNLPSFVSNKHYEICKHFTRDRHTRIPDILIVGTETWESLSSEEQQWLQRAALESSSFQRDLWQDVTEEALSRAKQEGVSIYDVNHELFASKVSTLFEAFDDQGLQTLVQRIHDTAE